MFNSISNGEAFYINAPRLKPIEAVPLTLPSSVTGRRFAGDGGSKQKSPNGMAGQTQAIEDVENAFSQLVMGASTYQDLEKIMQSDDYNRMVQIQSQRTYNDLTNEKNRKTYDQFEAAGRMDDLYTDQNGNLFIDPRTGKAKLS